jgi:hypothetical protein
MASRSDATAHGLRLARSKCMTGRYATARSSTVNRALKRPAKMKSRSATAGLAPIRS